MVKPSYRTDSPHTDQKGDRQTLEDCALAFATAFCFVDAWGAIANLVTQLNNSPSAAWEKDSETLVLGGVS